MLYNRTRSFTHKTKSPKDYKINKIGHSRKILFFTAIIKRESADILT